MILNKDKFYPLTPAQQRIWNTELLYPDSSLCVVCATLKIKGVVNLQALHQSIDLVIQQNDSIRIKITKQENEAKQYIEPYKFKPIRFIDFSSTNMTDVNGWLKKHSVSQIMLYDSELYEIVTFKLSDEEYGYNLKIHHIICDGMAVSVIINQINENYKLLVRGQLSLSLQKASYIDYIWSELQYEKSERFQDDRLYWLGRFQTLPECIKNKSLNPILASTTAKRTSLRIDSELYRNIHKLCLENNVNIFTFFLAVLNIYLYKSTNQQDVIIGTIFSNRATKNEKNTVGMFASTIASRTMIDPEEEVILFIKRLSIQLSKSMLHQKYPYNQLIQDIRDYHKCYELHRLFGVAIEYRPLNFIKMDGMDIEFEHHFCGDEANDLLIRVVEMVNDRYINLHFEYRKQLFDDYDINRMIGHLLNVCEYIIENNREKIAKVPLITAAERKLVLGDFNDTKKDYPSNKTIHKIFEDLVNLRPNAVAVDYEGKQMTYKELNERANQLARTLVIEGLQAEQLVGIMVERSIEMIVAILGVLKAGAAYVPIDPGYPEERIQYILQDSNARVLLLQSHLLGRFSFSNRILLLDENKSYHENGTNLETSNSSGSLAYVIYTSGTTGKPKGVMIEHRSIVNQLHWRTYSSVFRENERTLLLWSFVFDPFIYQLIGSMMLGSTVFLLNNQNSRDPVAIKNTITQQNINSFECTPSFAMALIDNMANDDLLSIKMIMIGGEKLSPILVKKIMEMNSSIVLCNAYGPTENSVVSSALIITSSDQAISIGKPIDNNRIYVLNNQNQLQPIGISGELCIAGEGLARGYLNHSDLTKEKFVADPFVEGARMYRTGDLARWLPDGNIEYLGRIDHQVKIRGFRIELGEIEVVISKFQSIQEVLVITHEHDDGEKDLCAYFVASRSIEVVKIKEVISEELPDYMIPRYFVQLDKMPLTLNGKIDHERLPVPEKSLQTNTEYIAPRTPLELELTRIWKEVLSLDKIGVKDNFFILGGHSLKILEALVKSTQAGLNISIKDYYDLKTIEAIASKLSNNEPKLIRKHEHTHHFFVTPPLKLCLNGEIDKPFNSENIMLTGSTGYLGVHILERLLKKTNCKITCILREKSNQSAAERLLETLLFYFKKDAHNITDQFNQRITVLCGDLSKTRFGLEEDVYMRLKSTIDEVIHSAALTKHFGTEEDFRLANVASVEHLLQFVGPDIKFHHVSTVSVSGILVEADEDVLFTEKDFYIKQDYKCNAYIESKFLAEQLIYDYIARGTNAVIYRVGNLTNRYSDGQHQKNIDDNAFLKRIKFMLTYGVMTDLFSADIEFTPVDHCSDAILNIIMQRVDSNKHYVFHLMNDKSLKYTQFLKILSELGYRVELMRHERFEYIMSNHQDDKQLQEQLQYIMAYRTIKDDHYKARVIVDNSFTNQCLEQLKWQWPEINKMYIRQMIQYMIDTEYLHRDERKILSLRK